jgi:hypothetical protein
MTDKDMRICGNKGFHLDLPNGVTVSVQFGPGNYCDSDRKNADFDAPQKAMDGDEDWGSNLAECAAYVTGSKLLWVAVPGYTGPGSDEDGIDDSDTFYDDVVGYLNVSQVLDFINEVSQLNLEPSGDYRDDPKIQEDERRVMDEFQQEETDEA